jgi:hypothetical protein
MCTIHKLQQCILSIIMLMPMTVFALGDVSTPPLTVNVHVDDAVEIYPDPLPQTTFDFDPISLDNYGSKETKTALDPFSVYVNDFGVHSVQLTLTTPAGESDADSTWMNITGGGNETIPYEVEYITCYNGHDRVTVNISKNTTDNPVVSCANHSCTIPNEYANYVVCTPTAGGEGKLQLVRPDLPTMPEEGDYTGQFTLTASLV